MKGLNKVMLIGTLGANPDFRVINANSGNKSVATVSIATNESFKDSNGNIKEITEWHRLVFWGKQAEVVRDYLHKGSQVYVEGKIRTRSYEDKNGQKKTVTEIQVTDLQMLGGKENSSASGQTQQQPQQGYAQQPYSSATQNDNYDAPYAADEYAF
jgi:single-strand DNA-binding protein